MTETILESIVVTLNSQTAGLQKGYAEALKSTQTTADSMTALMSQASARVGAATTQAGAAVASAAAAMGQATQAAAGKTTGAGEQIRTTLSAVGNVAKEVSANLGTLLSGKFFDVARGAGALASNAAMAIPQLQGVAATINTWVPAIERAVSGMSGFYRAGVSAAESLRKMSVSTGLSVQSTFALQHAANMAGFDVDTLSSGMAGLNRHLGQALNPTSEAARAMKAYGLSAADVATMSTSDALGQIGDVLKAIPSPAERAAASFALLGRRGQELLPFVMKGSEFMEKAAADARLLGNAVDAIDLKNIKEAGDAGKEFKAVSGLVLGNLQKSFAASFAPAVKTVQEGLANAVRYFAPVFQVVQGVFRVVGGIVQGVVNAGAAVARFFQPAFEGVMNVVKGVVSVLGSIPETIATVASAIGDALGPVKDVLGTVLGVLKDVVSFPFKVLGKIGQSMKGGVQDFGTGEFGGVQLADIKNRQKAEQEIRARREAIRKVGAGEASGVQTDIGFGQKIDTGGMAKAFGFEGVATNLAQKELDKQIAEMDKKREQTNKVQVEESKAKIDDQILAMERQQATLGMTAAEAAKYNAVQALMATTNLTATQAAERLGKSLDDLAAKQTQLGIAQAVDRVKEQTRALQLQTTQLGMSASMSAKYAAVAQLVKETGVSTTEAWKQLTPAFEGLDKAMAKQAVSEAVQKTQDQTVALENQLSVVGMTSEAAAKRLAILDLSKSASISVAEATERLTLAMDEQGRAQVALDSAKLSQGWKEQADSLMLTSRQADIYRLSVRGATQAQLDAARAADVNLTAMEALKKIMDDGKQTVQQFRLPEEVLRDRVEELNKQFQASAIDMSTYNRAVEAAEEQFRKATSGANDLKGALQGIQGAAAGSAEALSRINAFRESAALERRPNFQLPPRNGPQLPLPGAPLDFKPPQPVQPPGGPGAEGLASGSAVQLLREIRDALVEKNRKPGLEVKVGL